MRFNPRALGWGAVPVAAFLPTLAYAHTGTGVHFGLVEGVLHPLLGLDHLLAMVAVGAWAAQRRAGAVWVLPATFVLMMGVGGALGMNGLVVPFVESGIVLSVLVLGLLIAAAARVQIGAGMAMVAAFALLHGVAHGGELPVGANGTGYALGFMAVTALLHAGGVLAVFGLQRVRGELVRVAGGAIAASGALLALA